MKHVNFIKKAILAAAFFLTLLPVSVFAAHSNNVIDMSVFNFGVNVPGGTYTNWYYNAITQIIAVTGDVTVIGSKTDADKELIIGISTGATVEGSINLSHLPSGVYFVKLSAETGGWVQKIIKE